MYTEPLQRLLRELSRMPGIGEKTAERLAFYVLNIQKDEALRLADAIKDVKETVKNCSICYNIAEKTPCEICSSHQRDKTILCVVEQSRDLWAIEKSGNYNGLYHVLQGRISPLDGIGPGDLTMDNLINRIRKNTLKEVILATNPNTEGDATAYYIQKQIHHLPIKVTRIAKGVPAGSSLEYANRTVVSDAINGRREF